MYIFGYIHININAGFYTWNFLHTMVAYFPEKPTPEQKQDMEQFFKLLSRLYPCPDCANDFAEL